MFLPTGFTASAFIWLASSYGVFAMFCWSAPPVMAVLGLKLTMFVGSLPYALYVASFFYMDNAFYYFTAVANGIGAGLMWPASVNKRQIDSVGARCIRLNGLHCTERSVRIETIFG